MRNTGVLLLVLGDKEQPLLALEAGEVLFGEIVLALSLLGANQQDALLTAKALDKVLADRHHQRRGSDWRNRMATSTFVYVTYIRTTPEKLWSALTYDVEFMKRYWFGVHCESQWTTGSSWRMVYPDGTIADAGEIVQADPAKRLVIRWQHLKGSELKAEGDSLCTMELESRGAAVRLSITHTIEREPSKFITAVSAGWPQIVSNLKSLLETASVALKDPFPADSAHSSKSA